MGKHAYLIIVHKDDKCFRTLIKLLDFKDNDIYIHMDKKNKKYNKYEIESIVKYSNLYHIERKNVTWGGYSQIDTEIRLLEYASSNSKYDFYHLLSGQDLPIKDQKYIHNFFDKNIGKEFIRFEKEEFDYSNRVNYFYFFQEKIGKTNKLYKKIINELMILIQKILKIKRNKNIKFQKGTNWFSITDEFARYVVSKKKIIEKIFKQSFCCDEIFLQTIIINSEFKKRLFHSRFDDNSIAIMRLIDWDRGSPYTFKIDDYSQIKKSNMLFARKFQVDVDEKIINKIYNEYKL